VGPRCDECGAPLDPDARACGRCGAGVGEAAAEVVEGPRAAAGWRLARRSTLAYALAQAALMLASGASGVPWSHVGARAVLLAPLLAVPLWAARARSLRALGAWAATLCAGVPTALALMSVGVAPRGTLAALTLATGALWAAALVLAAWRVRGDRRVGAAGDGR